MLFAGIALGTALFAPAAAQASFHLMKIREVYRGKDAVTSREDAFVELQMYAAGQNLVAGKELRFYDAAGTQTASFVFPTNVANAENQRTILVGDAQVPGGVDFFDSSMDEFGHFNPPGGAACFVSPPSTFIDCVAWAGFSGTLPVGNPASPGTFADGTALTRSIARGCPTLLEAADDTDDSASDFSVTSTPSPRRNTVTPTEMPCASPGPGAGNAAPQTKIKKVKVSGRTATVKFEGSDDGSGKLRFKCKLDRKRFKSCTSPKRYKHLKPGKHKVQVEAIDSDGNVDPTPATKRFSV